MIYGDACSGVPGGVHEQTFASVNAVIRRLVPEPEFVIFPGDEIIGLTPSPEELRRQWRYWLDQEMGWLDRRSTPMWHTTGNHTVYNQTSEAIFRDTLNLPRNGPSGQEGLSYWVRRGDLLLVFVNTVWSGLGGEGHVETEWLREMLTQHADATNKLVIGHHPAHPVNGFSGPYQREIGPEHAISFWTILAEAGVLAYCCGHILAFDVQAHRGVLQICTGGAGTAHRMPEGIEYLHCVQAAVDDMGLRYQVLDATGAVRESLHWPMPAPPHQHWRTLVPGEHEAPILGRLAPGRVMILGFSGQIGTAGVSVAQTLLSAFSPRVLEPFWLGLCGPKQRLTAIIGTQPGRSPHYWLGPTIQPEANFDLYVAVYPAMGPGGILYRFGAGSPWSSLLAASATGPEQLLWPERWSVGQGQGGPGDRPFLGSNLTVRVVA